MPEETLTAVSREKQLWCFTLLALYTLEPLFSFFQISQGFAKHSGLWVACNDVVENYGVEAVPGIFVARSFLLLHGNLVAQPSCNILICTAKYFTSSFEREQNLLALAIAEDLKNEMWQQNFLTTDEKKRFC